jgi:hypothetical protein
MASSSRRPWERGVIPPRDRKRGARSCRPKGMPEQANPGSGAGTYLRSGPLQAGWRTEVASRGRFPPWAAPVRCETCSRRSASAAPGLRYAPAIGGAAVRCGHVLAVVVPAQRMMFSATISVLYGPSPDEWLRVGVSPAQLDVPWVAGPHCGPSIGTQMPHRPPRPSARQQISGSAPGTVCKTVASGFGAKVVSPAGPATRRVRASIGWSASGARPVCNCACILAPVVAGFA